MDFIDLEVTNTIPEVSEIPSEINNNVSSEASNQDRQENIDNETQINHTELVPWHKDYVLATVSPNLSHDNNSCLYPMSNYVSYNHLSNEYQCFLY